MANRRCSERRAIVRPLSRGARRRREAGPSGPATNRNQAPEGSHGTARRGRHGSANFAFGQAMRGSATHLTGPGTTVAVQRYGDRSPGISVRGTAGRARQSCPEDCNGTDGERGLAAMPAPFAVRPRPLPHHTTITPPITWLAVALAHIFARFAGLCRPGEDLAGGHPT